MQETEDVFHLGIKALIRNSDDNILLLKVNKQKLKETNKSYWDIPGGRIQRGETPVAALRREVQEETGIADLKNIQPFAMTLANIRIPQKGGDVGLILWAFTCHTPTLDKPLISEEHVEFAWCTPAEVTERLAFKYPAEFIQKLHEI